MENNITAFEQPGGKYLLRLYVADGTHRSIQALRNLRKLCDEHLADNYNIEIIDLMKEPQRAKEDQILAVPTLVRKLPTPIRKFIGNLAHPEQLLVDFDLRPNEAEPSVPRKGDEHVG